MHYVCPKVNKARYDFEVEALTKLPTITCQAYLLDDIVSIGLPIDDQKIYYYSQLHKIEFTKQEIDLLKYASRIYQGFDGSQIFAPYMPRV